MSAVYRTGYLSKKLFICRGTVVTKWLLSVWLCQSLFQVPVLHRAQICFSESLPICQSVWAGVNGVQGVTLNCMYTNRSLFLREVCLRCCCSPCHWCPGSTFSWALQPWVKRGLAPSQGLAWHPGWSWAGPAQRGAVKAVWWSVSTSAQQGDGNVLVGSYSWE